MSLLSASATRVLIEGPLETKFFFSVVVFKILTCSKPGRPVQGRQLRQHRGPHQPGKKCRRLWNQFSRQTKDSNSVPIFSLTTYQFTPRPIIPPSRASLPVEGRPPGPSKKNLLSVSFFPTTVGFWLPPGLLEAPPPNWS